MILRLNHVNRWPTKRGGPKAALLLRKKPRVSGRSIAGQIAALGLGGKN
jgi:hypothetical protein